MAERYQVVIIGGGPVGVALAVELGQRDISTLLVERQTTLPSIPKGQSLTNRTLEHFYFWNCVDELRAARLMPRRLPDRRRHCLPRPDEPVLVQRERPGQQRSSGPGPEHERLLLPAQRAATAVPHRSGAS